MELLHIPTDADGKWLHIIGAKVLHDGKELWVHGVYDSSMWKDGHKHRSMEIQFSARRIDLPNQPHLSGYHSIPLESKLAGWSSQSAPVGCMWYDLQILHPSPRPKEGDRVRCVCCKDRGIVVYPQQSSNDWISVRWRYQGGRDFNRAGITEVGDTLEVAYPEIA